MQNYELPYGQKNLTFSLKDDLDPNLIKVADRPVIEDYNKEIKKLLKNPVDSPPLPDIVNSGEDIVILVSDFTRLSYNTSGYLPILINELNSSGIPDSAITVVVANGMHRQQTAAEDKEVVGEEVYNRVQIENHDCKAEDLINLGKTSRGTDITINRTVYEADRIILTGGINYHLIAGFGGGRKSLAPGVCGYNTIQQNHSLALSEQKGIHPEVGSGILEDNPVAEDILEITEKLEPDFMFNVVVNEKKEFIYFTAGHWYSAFKKGCKVVEEVYGRELDSRADLVISSCGGYPKDIQLYQSIKGLDNSAYAVKDQGVIILASKCSQGIGPEKFEKWFQHDDLLSMQKSLKNNFEMPGFVALRTATILSKAKVILISSLSKKLVEKVDMIPAKSSGEAVKKAKNYLDKINSVNIMPQAAVTFPVAEE